MNQLFLLSLSHVGVRTDQWLPVHCNMALSSDNHSVKAFFWFCADNTPYSKVHGAYMGPTWGRQDPGGPHVGPVNFAIRDAFVKDVIHPSSGVGYCKLTLLVK